MRLQTIYEEKTNTPTRKLGRTGFNVPIISLGGQGSLESQGGKKNCIEIIQRAFELGIRMMDTSPIYGKSEIYYGKAMDGWRDKIFLSSKTDKRDRDGSLREIEKSLKRLNTDYLDLWQIHHLDQIDEVDQAISRGDSALSALLEMREQKVVKHIGITGHSSPQVLLEAMKRVNFDTVLCPINVGDRSMKMPFIDSVVKEANKQNMGIIGMKVLAQGYVFRNNRFSINEAIGYALSQDISTVIIGVDTIEQLENNVNVAKTFKKLDKKQLSNIENRAKPYRKEICFFRREFGGYDSKDKLPPL